MNNTKVVVLNSLGKCTFPVSYEDDMHEFALCDGQGKLLHTGYFVNIDIARQSAERNFPGNDYLVKDLTEEWYIEIANYYCRRIKKLHPSFKISLIELDLSKMYYSRSLNDWYTFIPFSYKGVAWDYRETASEDWICKRC